MASHISLRAIAPGVGPSVCPFEQATFSMRGKRTREWSFSLSTQRDRNQSRHTPYFSPGLSADDLVLAAFTPTDGAGSPRVGDRRTETLWHLALWEHLGAPIQTAGTAADRSSTYLQALW